MGSLTLFLYILMRDYLPDGSAVADIVAEVENLPPGETVYSNQALADHARALAGRIMDRVKRERV